MFCACLAEQRHSSRNTNGTAGGHDRWNVLANVSYGSSVLPHTYVQTAPRRSGVNGLNDDFACVFRRKLNQETQRELHSALTPRIYTNGCVPTRKFGGTHGQFRDSYGHEAGHVETRVGRVEGGV